MKAMTSGRPQILVVDDEACVLEEVAAVLSKANIDCQCCGTPEAALAAAELSPPDLVISDINLHGHSGLLLCEQLRQLAGLADVPVMFLSGAQIPDIIRRSHEAGGAYYLRKPFDPEVLLDLIEKAMWMPQVAAHHATEHSLA